MNTDSNSYYVRYNSLSHGALSSLKVLPWGRCSKELEEIQQSFLKEHQPQAATEIHLVLELANIVFRRQRLYQTENALFYKELKKLNGPWVSYLAKGLKISD